MRNKQVRFLENLVKIPSPSGFEEKMAEFIKQELLQYLPKTRIKIDNFNNVIATIKGTSNQVIMIDAHIDQIGYMVCNISKEGIISLNTIGGHDAAIMSARELIILTSNKGQVNATVNRRHSHLVEDEDDEAVVKVSDALVDIGIRGRRKVQSVVKIGDPVIFRPSFNHLRESYYSGYGFDDASGCFILLETIREIICSKKKPIPTLIFTFSAQEETWGKKLRPLLKQYEPKLFIEVDVTFATDWTDSGSDNDENRVGLCELGKGIVLYRGIEIDKDCFKLLNSTAKRLRIKVQYQASVGSIGYSSTEVTHEGTGIKALILGIPLRNMHSPVEIINLKDLNYGTQLLTNFLLHRRIEKVLER